MRAPFSFIKSSGGGAAAPTLSTVDPAVGDVDGINASIMTLTGTNYVATPTVGFYTPGTGTLIGSGTSVTFVNTTTVTCKPPALASGLYDVRITNPDTQFATLSNGYRAWTPAEITAVDFVGDTIKGVTLVSGKVSVWNNQKSGETVVTAQQTTAGSRPTLVSNDFGTGLDSFSYTPQNTLDAYDNVGSPVRRAMAGGYSWFSVVKYTSTDTTSSGGEVINCPLTVYGDTGGWGSGGFYSGQLTIAQFNNALYSCGGGSPDGRHGSGFNDGNPHLLGWTFSSGGVAKAYKGATQQGADITGTYDTTNQAWNRIGVGWTAVDGFDGKIGCFVVVRGVISGTDLSRLNDWARLRYGVT